MSRELVNLARKLARKIDIGRGAHLSAAEIDLLVVTGAYEVLQRAAADYLREAAQGRVSKRTVQAPPNANATAEQALEHLQRVISAGKPRRR